MSPVPTKNSDSTLETQLAALIKDVAEVEARLRLVEERFEATREIEKGLASVTERVYELQDLSHRLDAKLEALQQRETARASELQDDLSELRQVQERLMETAEFLNHQTSGLQDQLRIHAARLETLQNRTEEAVGDHHSLK